jgi:Mce-associated membrane protein
MLGRGKRSASDKKKPDAKSDKATKAEKAAKAAELAEEAAAKAREAARLAQIAADEAAEAEEPPKSPEKPESKGKLSEVDPTPETPSEDDSAPSEDDSTTPEPLKADTDEAEETEAEEDEDEPAKPKRPKLKKATKADDEDDEDDEPRRARLGLPTVIAVLTVLAIALGVGTTVLGLKVKEQRATQQAVKEASFASSHTAQKMSSYDYRTLDSDLKAASALTTGNLHTQYGKLAEQLKTVAVQQQAVSNTTVMKVGVVSATPDKVVTLVYANRSSATKNDKEQRLPESLRIKMTMVKKDGKWLASEVTVLS